jgi:hypothetical protein
MASFEPSRVLAGAICGGVTGGVVSLLVFIGPPAIRNWMFALEYPNPMPPVDQIAATLGVFIAAYATGLAILSPAAWWALRKFHQDTGIGLVAAVGSLCFLAAFAYEVVIGLAGGQVPGFVGCCNLTAGDAGGLTLVDGSLTLHGWDSAMRRALVAGATGMLITMVFWSTGPGRVAAPNREPR